MYDERPVISQLMTEYAAKDKNYKGIEVVAPFKPGDKTCCVGPPLVDAGPPRPVLYVQHDGTYVCQVISTTSKERMTSL